MLSEGRNNEVLAARGEGDDPNAAVFGALDPADQAFFDETVHGDADRTWGEIDDRTYPLDLDSALRLSARRLRILFGDARVGHRWSERF